MKKLIPLIMTCLVLAMICSRTEAQTTYTSNIGGGSGNWNVAGNWTPEGVPGQNDHVIIVSGDIVTLTQTTSITNLEIQAGGVLDAGVNNMTCEGNFVINGEYRNDLAAGQSLLLSGNNTNIDGAATGVINLNNPSSELRIRGDKTVLNGAVVTVNGDVALFDFTGVGPTADVTNAGSFIVAGDIDGNFGSPNWINAENSYVSVEAQLMSSGNLFTAATGNTVEYVANSPFSIKTPSDANNTYHNLIISGTNTLGINADLNINGNLNISSGTLNSNNNNLSIAGDFTIAGNFTEGTSTITLDGVADQNLSIAGGNTLYNFIINKTTGDVLAGSNVLVSNALTMTNGNIIMPGNTLTLGTSAASVGTLNFTAGRIVGSFERWISSVGAVPFPIGVAADARTVVLDVVTTGTDGSVVASFIESFPGNAGLPLNDNGVELTNVFPNGYWELSSLNGFTATSYNLSLTGDGFRSSPGVDAATRIVERADAGSDWVTAGTHQDASGTTAQRNGLSGAPAQYALGDDTECIPPVIVGINGSADVCTGATEGYSVNTPTAGSIYSWIVSGGTINGSDPVSNTASGLDLNAIQVDWSGTGQEGTVAVVETSLCSGDTVALQVNVNSIAPTAITGDTEVPENTTGNDYSVTGLANYSYTWTITGGTVTGTNPVSNTTSGPDLNAIQVDWGTAGAGEVRVVAQRTGCDAAPAVTVAVTIYGAFIPQANGDWADGATWQGDMPPGVGDNVRITGFDVSVANATTINNLVVEQGRILDVNNDFTVNGILDVEGTMDVAGNLNTNGFARIRGNASLAMTGNLTANEILEIATDGTVGVTGVLTANNDVTVDGQINISGTNDFNLAGNATTPVNTLEGDGTISIADGTLNIQNQGKEISAGASSMAQLTLSSGGINIDNNLTVTNNGNISINGDLDGGTGSSWVNGQNSRLTLNATIFPTAGTLSASATGNTVEYASSAVNTDIIVPSDSYFNLEIDGLGNKNLTGSLDINGDLILNNGILNAGASDYNIALAGDWNDTGGNFEPGASTVTFDGAGDQTITEIDLPNPSGLVTFDNVVVNKPTGALILDQANSTAVEIEGTILASAGSITFTNGVLQTTSTELLTIGRYATANNGNTNSYVDGPVLKRGEFSFTFPTGDGSIWAPLTVAGNNADRNDLITVQYFDAAFANTENLAAGLENVSTVEYWDIDVTAGASYTANLTFFWKDQTRSGITDGMDLRVARFNTATDTWEEIPQTSINEGPEGDITVNDVANFSPFTFASGDANSNPLPVDLLRFEAGLVDEQVELTWVTASELNNDFFEVQRSEDGTDWQIIGEVPGNGTINEEISYSFTDTRPLFGRSFYRLRQVDFDGQFEYSWVAGVDNPFTGEAMEVTVFPNPTEAGNINLRVLTGNRENKISVQLIDGLGHHFIDESVSPEVFNEGVLFGPAAGLAKGVYFLIVTQNDETIRERLIIQ